MPHADVLIIGAGAGGGAAALALAPSGLRVQLLERGGYLPREQLNWSPRALFLEERYKSLEPWHDALEARDFPASTYYYVGGGTKVYGSTLFRFREHDFEAFETEDGTSPAWPIGYADLEPFYARAERLYLVHGTAGADPTAPPRSAPFPHPALPYEPTSEGVVAALARTGLRPFPLPMGLDRNVLDPRAGRCIRCATCDGFPCPADAKADAQTATVDPALAYPNVQLQTGAHVLRLLANGPRVTGVEAVVDGVPVTYTADTVVLAAGAINSAALLLRSASEEHPEGLGNASGWVGRGLMKHLTTKFYAVGSEPNTDVFTKTWGVNDYYRPGPESRWPLGHVHLMGKHDAVMMAPDLPDLAPEEVARIARHSVDFWVQSEDLPDPENRVILTADGRVALRYRPNNVASHDRLMDLFEGRLRDVGFQEFYRVPMPLRVVNHQCGTTRMGDDPAESVVDAWGRSHDLHNLWVADAGVFTSSAASNPTLTIVAHALRMAERLQATC